MKFKKTSVIGVIFSLTLVLALTAAFASEPKTDSGTVEYHGRTYNRAELSQETLDWLDWYLTLPEEQQMAVSFEPSELHGTYDGSDINADDAFNSVKGDSKSPEGSFPVQGDPVLVEVTGPNFAAYERMRLDVFQTELAQRVKDGRMTQAEADLRLKILLGMLEVESLSDVKDPETYLVSVKPEDLGIGGLSHIFADYVVEMGPVAEYELQGEGHFEYDYNVELPTFDEDGNLVSADGSIIGTRFYDYEFVTDPSAVSGGATGGEAVPVTPAPSSAPANAFDGCTIVGTDENGYPLDEQGNRLVFDDNGNLFMKVRLGYGPCIRTDCAISEEHYHANGEVIPFPQSNAPTPVVTPGVGAAPMQSPYCPLCTETRLHRHTDGQTILLSDPCPVEGCTMPGEHVHDGVPYSCNGFHSGGYCDGSCYTSSQTNTTTTTASGHHSESHSSGRHGNSHH